MNVEELWLLFLLAHPILCCHKLYLRICDHNNSILNLFIYKNVTKWNFLAACWNGNVYRYEITRGSSVWIIWFLSFFNGYLKFKFDSNSFNLNRIFRNKTIIKTMDPQILYIYFCLHFILRIYNKLFLLISQREHTHAPIESWCFTSYLWL
jgi:hypothetical protein